MVVRIPACSRFFCWCAFFVSRLFLFGIMLLHSRVRPGPDIPGIILLYDDLYTWHVFIDTECCCRGCCCSAPVLLLQQLLLFIVVCEWQNLLCIESDYIQCLFPFSPSKNDLFFMYVTFGGTAPFTATICVHCIVGNYVHARSQGGSKQKKNVSKNGYIV